MKIKVAITDDHPMALQGINTMLSSFSHIKVTDMYNNGAELLNGLAKRTPDVLLLDILMPGLSGADLALMIRKSYPSIRIIVFTSMDAPSMVKNMLQYGCTGYVLKGADQKTLVEAVEHAYREEEYIEPTLKEHLLLGLLKSKQQLGARIPKLTTREKEVLQLVVEECTTQEIADKLSISARTAETHRLALLKKMGVKNSAGLVLKAMQWGLIGT